MKRKRVRREIELLRYAACGKPGGARLHQQPEHIEAVVLSEGRQSSNNITFSHISTDTEMCTKRQGLFL